MMQNETILNRILESIVNSGRVEEYWQLFLYRRWWLCKNEGGAQLKYGSIHVINEIITKTLIKTSR